MKRILITALSVGVVAALLFGILPATAAKPQKSGSGKDVIALSNGFPSGMHFNLNIHGKGTEFICDDTPGGKSVFIDECTDPENLPKIEYVSNKNKNNGDFDPYDLTVLDPCAMNGGTARVYLPYKVQVDGQITEAGGYYVFARILGKPNNKCDCDGPAKDCPPSSIKLYPNVVVQACSDPGGNNLDCLVALGLITQQDIYVATPEGFVRFDPQATPGKGKSKAEDITRLFTWSGWIFYGGSPETDGVAGITTGDIPPDVLDYVPGADLDDDTSVSLYEWKALHADFNGDGVVNQQDLDDAIAELPGVLIDEISDYVPDVDDTPGSIDLYDWKAYHPDSNGDGQIDQDDVLSGAINYVNDLDHDGQISIEEWLEYHESNGMCIHHDTPVWIFDIADLVVTQQEIENDGTKLLQIRFYPVETTEYIAPGYIRVDKITDPSPSEQPFTFDLDGPESYSQDIVLTEGDDPWHSGRLQPGDYYIDEQSVANWSLTNVEIRDPDDGSGWDDIEQKYKLDLDPGETIIIIFTNTQQQ